MSPLSTLLSAPAEKLARLGKATTPPGKCAAHHTEAAGWDNRPTWDNWSRR